MMLILVIASSFDIFIENAVLNKIGLKGPTEKAILSAMKEWEEKTCIRFKSRTNEKDYIEFIDDGFGQYVKILYPLSIMIVITANYLRS